MDAPSGQTNIADHLVQELNGLLALLSLPITVVSPYDLTPSLLLAILESILRARLPISAETRESRTPAAKVEAMKVFLGVLEGDVLQTDIGLSEIDPRRLAAGEWDEVVFVGETLCWLGRRQELHDEGGMLLDAREESSSVGSYAHTSVYTGFSRYDSSETTATTLPPLVQAADLPSMTTATSSAAHTPISTTPARRPPRCIHELKDPSFSFNDQSLEDSVDGFCNCSVDHDHSFDAIHRKEATRDHHSSSSPHQSVRYEGLIEPAEDDVEVFEAWKARSRTRSSRTIPHTPNSWTPRRPSTAVHNPTRHISPAHYTLSLLNERARLLTELAKLKTSRP